MGQCQGCCAQIHRESEVKIDHKEKSTLSSMRTPPQKIKYMDESVLDETCSKSTRVPPFVKNKQINQFNFVRNNRFLEDQEMEVRMLIRQRQLEYEEELRLQQAAERDRQMAQAVAKSLTQQQHASEKQSEKSLPPATQLDNQFSFQNSMKRYDSGVGNPYLPRQTSQFAPKKDGDTVSQKSQISKTVQSYEKSPKSVSPKSQDITKHALRKVLTMRDDYTHNASQGSSSSAKRAQLDAFEKIFSEYCSQDRSSSKSKKSYKSILKKGQRCNSSVNLSMSKNSVKSTRTIKKPKKVRFTKDTNFENERKSVVQKKNFWTFL